MKTRLERLYVRRRLLDQERARLTKLIATLERRGNAMAIAKVHHATEGCSIAQVNRPTQTPWGQRTKCAKKVTKDWKVVDCLKCLWLRCSLKEQRDRTPVPWISPKQSRRR